MEELIVQFSEFSKNVNNPVLKTGFLILVSIVSAKISDFVFSFLIKKVVVKTKSDIDDKIISYLHKPIYYSVLFIGLNFTIQTLENIPNNIEYILIGIFKSIAIIVWSLALFNIFVITLKWYSKRNHATPLFANSAIPLLDKIGRTLIFLGSIYFIFLSWKIDVTGWVASAGILSMVIGFGARDTIANLFSGISIMADAPYKEGDYINLDSGERGCVKSIGISSTRIITRDDIEITIPNSVIANSKIINESGGPHEKERVRLNISVSYGSNINKVREILLEIANNSDYACADPTPRVRFREFGEYGLKFQLLFWIEKPEFRGKCIDKISSIIHDRFLDEKIEIPYPQHTIHMKKTI